MAMATLVSCIRYDDCCIRSIRFGVSWSLLNGQFVSLVSAVVDTIVSEEMAIIWSSPYCRDIAMRTSKGRCLIPVEEPAALHFSCGWSLMRKQSKGQQSVNTIAEDLVPFAQFWLDYTIRSISLFAGRLLHSKSHHYCSSSFLDWLCKIYLIPGCIASMRVTLVAYTPSNGKNDNPC